jgi:hypothetical protein
LIVDSLRLATARPYFGLATVTYCNLKCENMESDNSRYK